MESIKIAALNLDIFWKSPQKNLAHIESQLQEVNADLVLLPEMFTTGFCMDAEEIADDHQMSLDWMKHISTKKNAAIAGTVSVKENGHFYNRLYFVKPDGEFAYYDKHHLFSYSGEDKIYTPGNKREIVEYNGFRILLQTCYDLRFPVFSRNKNDYDLAIYLANWPSKRVDAWRSLLKARAIENVANVFGVNRIGRDGNGLNYEESTDCYFADGEIISHVDGNWKSVNLSMTDLNDFRQKFQFLNDRDDFILL